MLLTLAASPLVTVLLAAVLLRGVLEGRSGFDESLMLLNTGNAVEWLDPEGRRCCCLVLSLAGAESLAAGFKGC